MENLSKCNINYLMKKKYPGRGIIIGLSRDKKNYVQIYWIMGRSTNSRNRIFVRDKKFLKNEIYDKSKVKDKSLILYYSMKNIGNTHIVSNGDQTDTIYKAIKNNKKTFESALNSRYYEPDSPNYTPRISGILYNQNDKYSYKLSIIKALNNDEKYCSRYFFNYENPVPGYGHFISTYVDDSTPLEPFKGEPLIVPVFNQINKNLSYYWDILNDDNKISLAVKFINVKSNNFKYGIINKNK